MAVFHFIYTPEYASDTTMMSRLASRLEQGGAGKLALRLRRGWEMPRLPWPKGVVADEGRAQLWTDAEPGAPRKPVDYWKYNQLPPERTDVFPHLGRREQLQGYYNAQLTYLLTKPATPYALSPLGVTPRAPGVVMPGPDASLRQLGRLLELIDSLEKDRGFVPNRITANIIVRCWIRCGMGTGESHDTPHPVERHHLVSTARGTYWAEKRPSTVRFGPVELRAIFEIATRAMAGEVGERGRLDRVDGVDRLDYTRHVRPFGKMMRMAAAKLGDREGCRGAVSWMVEERKRLEREGRAEVEQVGAAEEGGAADGRAPHRSGLRGAGGKKGDEESRPRGESGTYRDSI